MLRSLEPLMAVIRAQIGDHPCYLSFDIDAIDPGFCPGTGTPEIGGLTSIQALEIIRSEDICCLLLIMIMSGAALALTLLVVTWWRSPLHTTPLETPPSLGPTSCLRCSVSLSQ